MGSNASWNTNPGPGRPVRPIVGPLVLIVVGALFLYADWKRLERAGDVLAADFDLFGFGKNLG